VPRPGHNDRLLSKKRSATVNHLAPRLYTDQWSTRIHTTKW